MGPHTRFITEQAKGDDMRFEIGEEDFLLDGHPHRILSGAIHSFRVHPDLWADRIHKAKEMGLNTIETYVAWNDHEATPGDFDFTGRRDLGRFLDLVAAEGMHAIVRPGPYICAEWWNGGLPPWLFADSSVGIRRNEPQFLAAVRRYLEALAPILLPRQIDNDGPVVLVQIENEYGAYGSDPEYLEALVAMHREVGFTVPFTTVDQPMGTMLDDGSLPMLHKTGSFGSRVTERLATLRTAQPTGPLMCSEFWDGWFDSWGEHHHLTSAADSAGALEELLSAGASVNIYMFHGGTNFGFTNGANDKGVYRPIITSYDYDAPLDEAGLPTEKYRAFQAVLARYAEVPALVGTAGEVDPTTAELEAMLAPAPSLQNDDRFGLEASPTPAPSLPFRFDRGRPLAELLPHVATWSNHDSAPTMDELGQSTGLMLYRTEVDLPTAGVLTIAEVRDRAQVFLDGKPVGVLSREDGEHALVLPAARHSVLEFLVEDQGRVDYGVRIGEAKGLIGPVALDGVELGRWSVARLGIEHAFVEGGAALDALRAGAGSADAGAGAGAGSDAHPSVLAGPAFALGSVVIDGPPTDRFLALDGFTKGVAWVNGFCLGRYWARGPQRTLYVPGPVLREGVNEIVVFELQAAATRDARLLGSPNLGHTEA
jgi:beta-galactosidase